MNAYPHQLSGGMKQRFLTAMGICNAPKLLIMDEPTKGLDLILRGQIAGMIHDLHQELGMTVLLITHDLELAYKLSDDCYVMKQGEVAAEGATRPLFDTAASPALSSLLRAERELTQFFSHPEQTEAI